MAKVKDVKAWTTHIDQAQDLRKMTPKNADIWVNNYIPGLSKKTTHQRIELKVLIAEARDGSNQALTALAITLHEISKVEDPPKVKAGYF